MSIANLYGNDMYYEDQGKGDAILFLHGNPSSSYSWRKVLAEFSCHARCVAIDHMGFGKSAKPTNIPYSFYNHADFLEAFIRHLDLKNITLVIQDWGSAIGFDYAVRHQKNVRGIAFFEAIIRPYASIDVFPTSAPNPYPPRESFKEFRSDEQGGLGWQRVVEQNAFIDILLPKLLGLDSTVEVPDEYKKPFTTPTSRIPIWRLPKEIPIGGEQDARDVLRTVGEYSAALQNWSVPKLLIYSKVGPTLQEEHADWLRNNWNSKDSLTVYEIVGEVRPGTHFFQETHSDQFVQAFREWYTNLP